MPNVDQPAAHNLSRAELLERLAVAKAIGSSEQQEAIKALGLALREQYNQEQGTVGVAPPMEYCHSTVSVNEQVFLQMRQAIGLLQASMIRIQTQQSAPVGREIG